MNPFRSTSTQSTSRSDSEALARSAFLMAQAAPARANRRTRRLARRRSGQALLLAVLLMVFAALLGSTFIAVVSLNLNQTARQENLSSARASTNAGLQWMQTNLVKGALGDKWRPEMQAPPPAPGDPTYNFYYTSFERAQGWARTIPRAATGDLKNGEWDGVAPSGTAQDDIAKLSYYRLYPDSTVGYPGYVKFPDPRSPQGPAAQSGFSSSLRPSGNANAPVYLAAVKYLTPTNTPPDPGLSYSPNWGLIELSVIGLSEDNPTVFDRRVAYLGGSARSPLASVMRTVTNWDYVNNVVPEGRTGDSGGLTLQLNSLQGQLPPAPFYLSIGGPAGKSGLIATPTLRSVLVTAAVQNGTTATCTLAQPIAAGAVQGERVKISAALGSPVGLDYNNDGTPNLTTEKAVLNVSDPSNVAVPGGILVNGALTFVGNAAIPNLNSSGLSAFVRVSDLISYHDTASGALLPASTPLLQSAKGNNGATTFNDTLLNSAAAKFPFANDAITDKDKLVSDGRNALTGNVSDPTRQVRAFTPPSIEGRGNLDRYRQQTEFSEPNIDIKLPGGPVVSSDIAGLYGYGKGTYIDNSADVEKTSIGSGGEKHLMTRSELQNMWFGDATNTTANVTASITRLSKPYGARNTLTASSLVQEPSLEQRHIRGWIGPDEFRPRGVEIVLHPDGLPGDPFYSTTPCVEITRDELTEAGFATSTTLKDSTVPQLNKAWSDPNSGVRATGVYRRVLPWPVNGIIFTEGNALVRGGAINAAADPLKSITIVSMNNIYIDGSLNAGQRKVLLLAKNNVVVNPTRVLSRVEAQTFVTAGSTTTAILVNDPGLFRRDDWVQVNNSIIPQRVTNDPATTRVLIVSPGLSSTPPTGTTVRAIQDPQFNSGANAVPFFNKATRLGRFGDVVQRRLDGPTTADKIRMDLSASAMRRTALRLQADKDTADIPLGRSDTTEAKLSNKRIAATRDPQSSVVLPAEKYLNVHYKAPTDADAAFPATLPADNTAAANAPYDVISYRDSFPDTGPPVRFKKPPTALINGYEVLPVQPTTKKSPLYFFLAAVGNRFDFGKPLLGAGSPDQPSILDPDTYEIPMGTSVEVYTSGTAAAPLTNDHFDTVGGVQGARGVVTQFGFNPNFNNAVGTANPNEDALTIDQSFYTPNPPPAAIGDTFIDNTNLSVDDVNYTLDTRTLPTTPSTAGRYALSFKLNDAIVDTVAGKTVKDYFDPTDPDIPTTLTDRPIPYYRLSRLKLEGPSDPFNTANPKQYENLTPGATLDIRAFAYAQEGSWVVIPGGKFDDRVSTYNVPTGGTMTYLKVGNTLLPQPGEYLDVDSNGPSVNDGADLNRDGQITREERAAVLRLARYNYQINFTGAIMERQTANVVTESPADANAKGSVQDWMDKWATISLNSTSWSGDVPNAAPDLFNSTPQTGIHNIKYTYDPALTDFSNAFNQDMNLNDPGVAIPVSPDFIYAG